MLNVTSAWAMPAKPSSAANAAPARNRTVRRRECGKSCCFNMVRLLFSFGAQCRFNNAGRLLWADRAKVKDCVMPIVHGIHAGQERIKGCPQTRVDRAFAGRHPETLINKRLAGSPSEMPCLQGLQSIPFRGALSTRVAEALAGTALATPPVLYAPFYKEGLRRKGKYSCGRSSGDAGKGISWQVTRSTRAGFGP